MIEKGFYHPDRGYWQTIGDPSEEIRNSYPEGTIETPLRPSQLHTWNGSSWDAPSQAVLDDYAGRVVRGMRGNKLATEVDPVVMNSLRWNSMTANQQQAWADYRQALLDIPQQAGFPNNVTWPSKPE